MSSTISSKNYKINLIAIYTILIIQSCTILFFSMQVFNMKHTIEYLEGRDNVLAQRIQEADDKTDRMLDQCLYLISEHPW